MLRAIALSCSLKPSPARSSSALMAEQMLDALREQGVEGSVVRIADEGVVHSVEADAGGDDGWPAIRQQVLDADILILTTPIWNGQPSSWAMVVSERLNAMLSETDDRGHTPMHGKVGMVGVVGNEDGAHHVTALLSQVLVDMGTTIPAQGYAYWVGEALHTVDFQDLPETPDEVRQTQQKAAKAAVHLARLLKANPY